MKTFQHRGFAICVADSRAGSLTSFFRDIPWGETLLSRTARRKPFHEGSPPVSAYGTPLSLLAAAELKGGRPGASRSRPLDGSTRLRNAEKWLPLRAGLSLPEKSGAPVCAVRPGLLELTVGLIHLCFWSPRAAVDYEGDMCCSEHPQICTGVDKIISQISE